ncbi:unnamed protein product, partial [Symbiodinium microadriaticum]
ENTIERCEQDVDNLQAALREFVGKYKLKVSQIEGKYNVDKTTVVTKLQEKLQVMDDESEGVARDFVNGDRDLNTFLKEFIDQRMAYHSLSIKLSRAG